MEVFSDITDIENMRLGVDITFYNTTETLPI